MAYSERGFKNQVYQQLARVGKALSSPVRLEMLDLLCQGQKTVESLAKFIDQSVANTSQHLQVLRQAGLIGSNRSGNNIFYFAADEDVSVFTSQFRQLGESHVAEIRQITKLFLKERGMLERIDHEELLHRVRKGEVTLIDVRPLSEYVSGHIPSAISVPIEELEKCIANLPKEREIVAYCRGPLCVMAIEAVKFLRAKGFKAVRMEQSVSDWQAKGLPLSGGMQP